MKQKCSPYHSKANPGVYHIYSDCPEGNNIEAANKAQGRNGQLCKRCAEARSAVAKGKP